jgi:hypothetical protein
MNCFNVGGTRCLRADHWLAGAIGWLGHTSAGSDVLRMAANAGTTVQRNNVPPSAGAYGFFDQRTNAITIDRRLDDYGVWERGTILAHELKHAADFADGRIDFNSVDGCYQTEENAFHAQSQVWTETWKSRLPMPQNSVQKDLNTIDLTISRDPYAFLTDLLTLYKHQCGGRTP